MPATDYAQTSFVDCKSSIPVITGGLPSTKRHSGSQVKVNSLTCSSASLSYKFCRILLLQPLYSVSQYLIFAIVKRVLAHTLTSTQNMNYTLIYSNIPSRSTS